MIIIFMNHDADDEDDYGDLSSIQLMLDSSTPDSLDSNQKWKMNKERMSSSM